MSNEDEPMAEMNFIPLIDIALTLLIIMMVTTAFIKPPGVSLKLPETATREGAPETPKDLTIVVAENGSRYVDAKPIDDAALQGLLRAMAAKDKESRVLVKADRGVVYEHVMSTMDLVRQAGLTKVVLPTEARLPGSQQSPVPASSGVPVPASTGSPVREPGAVLPTATGAAAPGATTQPASDAAGGTTTP
jgi:biopolymer transport protein ExbD